MTKIINLFGGAGIGKSSIAGGLLHQLKKRHYSVDAPYEFPKVLAWDSNSEAIKDQLFVIGNQHRGITRSWGNVDYIIMDSPILLALVYKNLYNKAKDEYPSCLYGDGFDFMIANIHNYYDNVNIFIKRTHSDFEDIGRYQNLEESVMVDDKIKETLNELNVKYYEIQPDNNVITEILKLLNIT